MTILYLLTRSERGGTQAHVLELLKAGRQLGRMILAVGEEGPLTDAARALGIEVYRVANLVHPIRPLRDRAAVRETIELLRRLKPDLVHCHSSKAGLVGRLAAWRAGIPAVFTAHGWEFAPGLSWARRLSVWPCEWVAARCAGRIITVSQADFNLALRGAIASEQKLVAIPNGIADDTRRSSPGSAGPVRIVMVSRLASPKDPGALLEALRGIPGEWRLELVGDGPDLFELKQLAQTLDLKERVTFSGDRADVPEILAKAHVFTLISRKEGCPVTILEAMRAGLPVVASNVGGVREQVVDGQTGYLVNRGDTRTLRDRLGELIRSPGLRIRMGLASRLRYRRYFTLERMLDQTWDVYQQLLPDHRYQLRQQRMLRRAA